MNIIIYCFLYSSRFYAPNKSQIYSRTRYVPSLVLPRVLVAGSQSEEVWQLIMVAAVATAGTPHFIHHTVMVNSQRNKRWTQKLPQLCQTNNYFHDLSRICGNNRIPRIWMTLRMWEAEGGMSSLEPPTSSEVSAHHLASKGEEGGGGLGAWPLHP